MEVKLTALPPPLTLPNVVFHSVYIYKRPWGETPSPVALTKFTSSGEAWTDPLNREKPGSHVCYWYRTVFPVSMQCNFCHWFAACILTRTASLSECLRGGWVGRNCHWDNAGDKRRKGRKTGQRRLEKKTAACLWGHRRGVLWSSWVSESNHM